MEEKIKIVEDGLKKLLEENSLDLTYNVQFPQYNILPNKLQLALIVIEEEQGKIVKVYTDKVQSKQKAK